MPEEEVGPEEHILYRGPRLEPGHIPNDSGIVPAVRYSEFENDLINHRNRTPCVEGSMSDDVFSECCNNSLYAFTRTATAENMHQLAVAIAKIDDRNVFRTNNISLVDNVCIEHTRTRRSLFRRWQARSLVRVKQVSKMFLIVTKYTYPGEEAAAYIYIPPKIFHNDDFTSFILTKPALYAPRRDSSVKVTYLSFPQSFLSDNIMPETSHRLTHWKTSPHFHVSESGDVCLGTELPLFNSQTNANDIAGMCMTVDSILSSYDRSDPYHHPHQISPPEVIRGGGRVSYQLGIERTESTFRIYPQQFNYISAVRSEVDLGAGFKLMLTEQEKHLLDFHGPAAKEALIELVSSGTPSYTRFVFLFPPGLEMVGAWRWMGFDDIKEFGEYDYLTSFNPPTSIPSSSDYKERLLMTPEDFAIHRLELFVGEQPTDVSLSAVRELAASLQETRQPSPFEELQDEQEPESEEPEPEYDEDEDDEDEDDEYEGPIAPLSQVPPNPF